jgi:hypothetical protein
VINVEPNTKMRDEFRAFCVRGRKEFRDNFTKSQARAVRLMHLLKQKKAPLDTFDKLMEWHHREAGDITEKEGMAGVKGYMSRNAKMKFLTDRYNMEGKFPETVGIKLPSSGAKVNIVRHNVYDCLQSLLTDPRLTDDDYNFLDNDPFKPPLYPKMIGDLNTAQAYYAAHNQYITKTNQILLPILMYIDGAATGQFRNLPVTALKMTPGIFTRKTRDKNWAHRIIGQVPQVK